MFRVQKNLCETEITLFCYPQSITDCHIKKVSHMTYCDWLEIIKQYYSRFTQVFPFFFFVKHKCFSLES